MNRKSSALALGLIVAGVTLTAAWTRADAPVTPAPDSALVAAAEPVQATTAAVRFVVAPTGNEARYRVTEQLAGFDLPNDAVGVTSNVTGGISVDENGAIIPAESRIVVGVATLRSDKDRRDGYVRSRLLETEKYPTVELVPTSVSGLPSPLPTGQGKVGPRELQLVGNLTVRGVTRPTTWRVTATYENGRITGTAATAFTFEQFQMTKPRVPVVLSVVDTIRLEYDFTMVRQ